MKTKKIIILLFTIIISTTIFAGLLMGCEKPKPPYDVRLDVYHPDGELLMTEFESSASLSLKYDGKPKVFDFKVYNKDLKKYLVVDNVSGGTVNDLCRVYIKNRESNKSVLIKFEDATTWPTDSGSYDITICFNKPIEVGPLLDDNYSLDVKRIRLTIEEE